MNFINCMKMHYLNTLNRKVLKIKDFYKEIRSAFNEDENSDVAVFAKDYDIT